MILKTVYILEYSLTRYDVYDNYSSEDGEEKLKIFHYKMAMINIL